MGSGSVSPVVSFLKGAVGDYALTSTNATWSITALPVTLTAGSYSGHSMVFRTLYLRAEAHPPTLVTCTNNPTGPWPPAWAPLR